MTAAVAGCRWNHLPHTDVSLLQRATASFTVDGFLKSVVCFLCYMTLTYLVRSHFLEAQFHYLKAATRDLGKKKKQVHDFCVRGNNST